MILWVCNADILPGGNGDTDVNEVVASVDKGEGETCGGEVVEMMPSGGHEVLIS